jgi:hypothetical protein
MFQKIYGLGKVKMASQSRKNTNLVENVTENN